MLVRLNAWPALWRNIETNENTKIPCFFWPPRVTLVHVCGVRGIITVTSCVTQKACRGLGSAVS